jgi:hypothetical protein
VACVYKAPGNPPEVCGQASGVVQVRGAVHQNAVAATAEASEGIVGVWMVLGGAY